MGDACCGHDDEPRPAGAAVEDHEPARSWEVRELRAAVGAGRAGPLTAAAAVPVPERELAGTAG